MNAISRLRLGTRGSNLALRQAAAVVDALNRACPELFVQKVIIKTRGDMQPDRLPVAPDDRGLFTKELERELSHGTIDIAVHSLKDLPSTLAPGLCIGAVLERSHPLDVLVSESVKSLAELPQGARIGTSSIRRAAHLRALRPDVEVVSIRGNIETRVRKMHELGLDALVLGHAGIVRLGLEHLVAQVIPPHLMLPAPGQGAIAAQARTHDRQILELLEKINDLRTFHETLAERSFLRRLGAGCHAPIGCLAQLQGEMLWIRGCIASFDGSRMCAAECTGTPQEAEQLGKELAEQLLSQGGEEIFLQQRAHRCP